MTKDMTKDWIAWYKAVGIDTTYTEHPVNQYHVAEQRKAMLRKSPAPSITSVSAISSTSDQIDHPALACQTLEALQSAMTAFEGCTLKYGATNMVFSDGVPTAPVMVIGEAPGEQEDLQAKPFVGMSGQLLDKILGSIGLYREKNVYITNMVNWRPPQNRAPTPAELAACLPFLYQHIALIQPKIIILAGGVAAKTLLMSNDGIMKLRGRWFDFHLPQPFGPLKAPISLIVTYHPAFLLRSPSQKNQSWVDMLRVKEKMEC